MKKALTSFTMLALTLASFTAGSLGFSPSAEAAERTYTVRSTEAFLLQTLVWWRAKNGGFTMQDRIKKAQYLDQRGNSGRTLFVRLSTGEMYSAESTTECRMIDSWFLSECPASVPNEGWVDFSADQELIYQTFIDNSATLEFLAATIGERVRIRTISIDDSATDRLVLKVVAFGEEGDYFPTGTVKTVEIARTSAMSEATGSPEYRYETKAGIELPKSWGYREAK